MGILVSEERNVMQVTVEDLSTVKKTLHIEIPEEDVNREVDAAYGDLKKTVKVKGFRPGKTPRSVLERMYKKDVNADVSQKLIQDAFIEAIRETGLGILGTPKIEDPEFDGKGPLKVDITIEVKPPVGEIDFKGLSIKKTLYAYGEEEVDGQIEMLRRNLAKKEPLAEERPVEDGDFVLINYEGSIDGEAFAGTPKTENHAYRVGRATLSKGFDDELIGMEKGASKQFAVVYPEDYVNNAFAGKTIDFDVTLVEIHEEILPEVDDELAKNIGTFASLDALKDEIRKNLQQGYDKRIEQELNEQIFTTLIEKTDFELPEVMVEFELNSILDEAERAFSANGISMEQLGQTRETLSVEYRELAEKQVRRHLILGAIMDQEEMQITDEEVQAGFEELAANFNQPVDLIKSFYEANPEKLDFFKHTQLEKKAIQLILDNSTIEEVAPEAAEAAAETGDETTEA